MSGTEFRLTLPDAAATERLGAQLAALSRAGDCITLAGGLGAGKTTLARAFIRRLAGEVEVTSPTFTLLNIYEAPTPVWHADLYRLESAGELVELGLEEAPGILLVEWPEIADKMLPKSRLTLELQLPKNDQPVRVIVGKAPPAWYSRLKEGGVIP